VAVLDRGGSSGNSSVGKNRKQGKNANTQKRVPLDAKVRATRGARSLLV
jgi:hypothetical protein